MNHTPAPSSYRVMQIITLARDTLDRLREDDGLVIETEEELRSALNEEGAQLDSIMAALGCAALDAKLYVELISQRMADLRARQDRAERWEEVLRNTLLQAMQMLDVPTWKDPEFTAGVGWTKPKVYFTDVDLLPANCVRHKVEKIPDKAATREAIINAAAEGKTLPGATLGNPEPYLVLRSK